MKNGKIAVAKLYNHSQISGIPKGWEKSNLPVLILVGYVSNSYGSTPPRNRFPGLTKHFKLLWKWLKNGLFRHKLSQNSHEKFFFGIRPYGTVRIPP